VIVTVTLNAALGVSYAARGVTWDATNQVSDVRYRAAGRGVAVARVLHTFGHEVIAAGLAGGSAGEMIRADLARSGIPAEFTGIGRESRRVLEVLDDATGRRLRFSEPGPFITTEELGRFGGGGPARPPWCSAAACPPGCPPRSTVRWPRMRRKPGCRRSSTPAAPRSGTGSPGTPRS
jgi:tagatose 6-phosphate kinase